MGSPQPSVFASCNMHCATAGAYLFGHFSLSHTFMPVVEEGDQPSWVRFAMEHSVDISPGNWMVDWVMVRK